LIFRTADSTYIDFLKRKLYSMNNKNVTDT